MADRKMKTIKAAYLQARHWQIFIVFAGIIILSHVITLPLVVASTLNDANSTTLGLAFGAVMAVGTASLVGWFASIGTFTNTLIKAPLRPKTGFFRFALIYPILYMFVAGPFFLGRNPSMIGVILPLHFFAVFCLFYDLHFASKNFVLARTGKRVTFYDYAGPFFLMWFFPIGVWSVQPKINQLYAERSRLVPGASEGGGDPPEAHVS